MTSRGTREPQEYFAGKRSVDFTDPLEDWEMRQPSVRGVLAWVWNSFEPFMPPGARHWTLPVAGLLGKTRTVELSKASDIMTQADTSDSEMRSMVLNAQSTTPSYALENLNGSV